MTRVGVFGAAFVIIAAAIVGYQPRMAAAAGFHEYSVATMNANAYAQTGILVVRYDTDNTVSPGPCPTPPTDSTGPVVYQTQWLIASSFPLNWLELGTGNTGNACRYHFWGYGENSVWNPYGWEFISTPSPGTRYFEFHRYSGNWSFQIDGVNKWNIAQGTSTWAGIRVEAGLESYDASAGAPYTAYSQLQYTVSEGPWSGWVAANTSTYAVNWPMCGYWQTVPSTWVAGENVC